MKANARIKESLSLVFIYKELETVPKNVFKHFIPHFIYVSETVKSELLNDGYKLSYGDWDGHIKNALIIEW